MSRFTEHTSIGPINSEQIAQQTKTGVNRRAHQGKDETVTVVGASATSVSLIGENLTRNAIMFENSDSARCYVLLGGGTATTANYSFSLAQYGNKTIDNYKGPVSAIWASANAGNALVTEIHA